MSTIGRADGYSVACALLSLPPFSGLPLHLRFFVGDVFDIFERVQDEQHLAGTTVRALPKNVTKILDLGGVSGSTGQRRESTQGVQSKHGAIDVQDTHFRQGPGVWGKWKEIEPITADFQPCQLCQRSLDMRVGHCRRAYVLIDARIICHSRFVQRALNAASFLT